MGIKDKPPLGLTPQKLHSQHRALDIVDAMRRYILVNKPIPTAWIEELRSLYEEA